MKNEIPEEFGILAIVWGQSWSDPLPGFLLRLTVSWVFCYIQSSTQVPDISTSKDNKIEKNDDYSVKMAK